MTEHPILFTPENAQKVHEGTKTQTRRIIKPPGKADFITHLGERVPVIEPGSFYARLCPYGGVGDRLWVREAWRLKQDHESKGPHYKGNDPFTFHLKYKPSIHMPRWACRTVLELTEIRVEQVRQIVRPDAIAEGMKTNDPLADFMAWWRERWVAINGPESWERNDWVWVLAFRKVN